MKNDWELVPRGDVLPQYAGLSVTMNTKGVIAMSRVTHEKLGRPAFVDLLYDKTRNRIGLKPAGPACQNTYPVHNSNKNGAKALRAWRLISEYRIDLPHTVRFYDAEIDDQGILILDLRTAKPCPRAAARNRKHEE